MGDRPVELVPVTERVYLARGEAVNWLLVTDDTGVMLIDAGYPGDRADVLASLGALGFQAADVRAVLLTHAHVDHFGAAIWLAKAHRTPIYCHADEVGHAKREYLSRPRRWPWHRGCGGRVGRCGACTCCAAAA